MSTGKTKKAFAMKMLWRVYPIYVVPKSRLKRIEEIRDKKEMQDFVDSASPERTKKLREEIGHSRETEEERYEPKRKRAKRVFLTVISWDESFRARFHETARLPTSLKKSRSVSMPTSFSSSSTTSNAPTLFSFMVLVASSTFALGWMVTSFFVPIWSAGV